MSANYNELLNLLKRLKEDFCATGLKLELETEIISTAEIELAQKLACDSNLDLTLKLSGGSAVSDIFLAKALDVKNLLSPMIESVYALEKFYSNVKQICGNEKKNLLFNIETITAFKNLDSILEYSNINQFTTVVFGRNDFCGSLQKLPTECDSQEVLEYVQKLLKKIENSHLNLTIGGNVSKNSYDFFKKINSKKFTHVETRKITFDKSVLDCDFENALKYALEFELLWLKTKTFKNPLDIERQAVLKERLLR